MKFKNIYCGLLLWIMQATYADPLLVVVLMVKDEASVIVPTLQPFVDAGIKDFVIFDTGSTDGTQEVVTNYLAKCDDVTFYVEGEPWINFGESRNHALRAAERLFPQATFMLMPDAEWYMQHADQLVTFCKEHQYDVQNSYLIKIKVPHLDLYSARLFRCGKNIEFVGRTHEVLKQVTYITLPENILFEYRPAQIGQAKTIKRWERDRDLLLEDYEENPLNARTLFYLAQSYHCLGDFENAYTFYEKRSQINGWPEENYMAFFRLGNVSVDLFHQKIDKDTYYSLAIKHYLKAYSMRPKRAEPLIKLARFFLEKDEMYLSYIFALRSIQIPYPKDDLLFVETPLYTFDRYDILGRCSWYVHEHEVGKQAVLKALEAWPDAPHLHRNLKLHIEGLQGS